MSTATRQCRYLESLDGMLRDYDVPDQEKRLIAAALEALTDSGYMDTTVDQIVTSARASKSTFYKYFRNKEAILIRILHLLVDVLIRKVEASIQSQPPTSKRTYHAIRTYIETCFLHKEVTKLLMVDTVGVAPALEATRFKFHRYFFDIFHREISQATLERGIRNCDPWVLSNAMVGAVQEVIIQSLIADTPPAPHHLAEVLETMVSRSLRAEPQAPRY